MTDLQRICPDCQAEFTLTSAEQLFYAERGYHEPDCCPECRAQRRANRHSELIASVANGSGSQRLGTYGGFAPSPSRGAENGTRFTAVCSACGGEAVVPFHPRPGRPVYCRKCFSARRA